MYRIPKDLDLSPIVGDFTTQLRVGQYDIQFTLGNINFAVASSIKLYRSGTLVTHWKGQGWPSSEFYDIMNTEVTHWKIIGDTIIAIEFANGMSMHLEDDLDQYESMNICFGNDPTSTIYI